MGVVEKVVPWTKVGVVDWATAVRERRIPKAAIAAKPAVDGVECKYFTRTPSFFHRLELGLVVTDGASPAPDRPLPGSRRPSVVSTTQKPLPCHCGAEEGRDDCSLTLLRRWRE